MTAILYLDTEFNGHNGALLSLALASEDGKHFYGRLPDPAVYDPWVEANVVPMFDIEPESFNSFNSRLRAYLEARDGCFIYADYPADFRYLLAQMCNFDYPSSWFINCQLMLLKSTDPKPKLPHNALSDAIALMNWHREFIERSHVR